MKLAYTFRLPLVLLNLLLVVLIMNHVQAALFAALFTGLYLFVYYVTNPDRSLGMTGAIFNYIGVVAGGIAKSDAVLIMALMGSIFMLVEVIMNRQD